MRTIGYEINESASIRFNYYGKSKRKNFLLWDRSQVIKERFVNRMYRRCTNNKSDETTSIYLFRYLPLRLPLTQENYRRVQVSHCNFLFLYCKLLCIITLSSHVKHGEGQVGTNPISYAIIIVSEVTEFLFGSSISQLCVFPSVYCASLAD